VTAARRPRRQGEGQLSDAIREALAYEPGLRLFRNAQCAVVKSNRMVRGGLGNGSADLVGLLAPTGRMVALEVKVPGEVPTAEQMSRALAKGAYGRSREDERMLEQGAWLHQIREHGGFAAYVSSVEEARAAIARARQGATG
jgi:hypothetical protein